MATIAELANELVLPILLHSIDHSSSFVHDLSLGHVSTWSRILRHKKSIVLVCRRWNAIGTPLLYEDVVIRRLGQLAALLNTLVDSECAEYICSLTIARSCYVPDVKAAIFQRNLRALLSMCPKLQSLTLIPFSQNYLPISSISRPALPTLTKLELSRALDATQTLSLLQEFSASLKSLSIEQISGEIITTPMKLISLRELYMAPPSQDLPQAWDLPSLECLRVCSTSRVFLSLMDFITKHGRLLKYLALWGSPKFGAEPPSWLFDILSHCPNTKHLALDVVPSTDILEWPGDHKTARLIQTLDIFDRSKSWREVDSNRSWQKAGPLLTKALPKFPSLEVIRFVSEAFLTNNLFDSPLPDHVDPVQLIQTAFEWQAPDVDLRVDSIYERLATDPSRPYQDVCVYVVHQPSAYHPLSDAWGSSSLNAVLSDFADDGDSETDEEFEPMDEEAEYEPDSDSSTASETSLDLVMFEEFSAEVGGEVETINQV